MRTETLDARTPDVTKQKATKVIVLGIQCFDVLTIGILPSLLSRFQIPTPNSCADGGIPSSAGALNLLGTAIRPD